MSEHSQILAERNRHMVAMYEAGMNGPEIAHEFMINTKYVNLLLHRLGCRMRSKGTRVRWIGAS